MLALLALSIMYNYNNLDKTGNIAQVADSMIFHRGYAWGCRDLTYLDKDAIAMCRKAAKAA